MDYKTRGQIYLPGTTDRISQLTWVSLSDGHDNSVMGYNSGGRLSSSYTNNVLVGTNVATSARSMATSVLVGAAAGQLTDRLTDTVGLGYKALSQATDVASSVIVGALAGTRLRRTNQCVAVGYRAMQNVRDGSSTVAVGAAAAQSFQGQFNTVVGAQCASNVRSQYSTIVGSRNMNRRSGQQVELGNCCIVGENIRFDNPIATETLRANAAFSIRSAGPSFYDSTHPFVDPFLDLGANGRVMYYLEESREAVVLEPSERSLNFFESLRLPSSGSYTTSWDVQTVDDQKNIVTTPPYACEIVTSSANATHIQANLSVKVDGGIIASKLYKISNLPQTLATALPYMDLSILAANGNLSVNATLFQSGTTLPATENGPLLTSYANVETSSGFTLEDVASSQTRTGTSYWELTGTSSNSAAYTVLQYNKHADSTLLYEILQTASPHDSSTGAVDAGQDVILVNASAGVTGNVNVLYYPGTYVSNLTAGGNFNVHVTPVAGTFGVTLLEYYTVQCTVDTVASNALTVALLDPTGRVLFDTTTTGMSAPFWASTLGTGTSKVPISLSDVRAVAADVWVFVDCFVDVDAPEIGVQIRLRVRGYSATGYLSGAAPLLTQDYYFTAVDPSPPPNSQLYQNNSVEYFVHATEDVWTLRDVLISTARYRLIPQFNGCVFIGSNFSVDNPEDRSNIFLLSLGPSKTLMRGTPNVLEVFATSTSVYGPMTVGQSPSNNYLAFRGTAGDGFVEQTPRTYIGERIYETGSQRSELLLFKGDDGPGTLGPDRVRVLAGEFRVDIPATANVSTYEYPGTTFDTVGQVATKTVLVSDAISGTQLAVAQASPTLVANGFLGFSLAANNAQLQIHVRGTDGITRTAQLPLS